MKSLQEFKVVLTEEEKSDYSKFDALVRAGLANKAQLMRIHKILDKMQEERPTFNNADRMILQNLFNKMVDLITNNKQIFQKTRQAVREQVEEGTIDTSDFKNYLSPEGGVRKGRAHRISVGSTAPQVSDDTDEVKVVKRKEAETTTESIQNLPDDPPFTLVLKRKAIRLYPDKTKIALYYNDRLGKHFSVPYTTDKEGESVVQAEEVIEEMHVMDHLHKIVDGHAKQRVKFANGQTRSIDSFTASAVVQLHKALNDDNKKKLRDMVHKSPEHLAKAADFAFKNARTKT